MIMTTIDAITIIFMTMTMRIGLYPFFPVNRRLTRDVVNNDNKEEDNAYDRDEDDDSVDDDDDDDDDDWSVSLPPYPVNRGLTSAKAPPSPPESLIYLFTTSTPLHCSEPYF